MGVAASSVEHTEVGVRVGHVRASSHIHHINFVHARCVGGGWRGEGAVSGAGFWLIRSHPEMRANNMGDGFAYVFVHANGSDKSVSNESDTEYKATPPPA